MKVGNRLAALERAALDQDREDLASGYRHAAEILAEEVAALDFIPVADAKAFCDRHCWHGRKDGAGKSDECSICPLASHTLGVIEDDDAGEDVESKRMERASREASEAMDRLDAAGLSTFAAESHVTRSGPGGLMPGDD
jgi:hypothetical protein